MWHKPTVCFAPGDNFALQSQVSVPHSNDSVGSSETFVIICLRSIISQDSCNSICSWSLRPQTRDESISVEYTPTSTLGRGMRHQPSASSAHQTLLKEPTTCVLRVFAFGL